ncbi:MAG: LuxR C-terminal-related transcriptional regulator [Prolixibacteraceae bacterium]|nr:LuxR C-terminal-related transcriptional regulator [Prolixibacteraceae bacterium]
MNKILFALFLCSIPFLLFSWWFYTDISIHAYKFNGKLFVQFSIFTLSTALSVGFFFFLSNEIPMINRVIQSLSFGNMAIMTAAGIFFFFKPGEKAPFPKRFILLVSFLLLGFSMIAGAKYYPENHWLAMVFILFVFIAAVFLPFIFKYVINVEQNTTGENFTAFQAFCQKFGISKREAEIIEQVCAGLTNQEIADKLFITLQTVKDHVSRIYLKTNVRNRTELANLVREIPKN